MENTQDPYIKLSRIRNDYGVEGRQGTTLHLSELDVLEPEQLVQLRAVLEDECQDIDYQIRLEMKRCEKDSRWMYGSKHSLKARQQFIDHINEKLGDRSGESVVALRFMRLAKQHMDQETYASLLSQAQGKTEVFSVDDITA